MVYATNLEFAQHSGLGLRIVDENVGTGDNSETDFDLDRTNVISGSYTLSYATSGSNTFTALTETTHYTLDKESGRVVLEAAGVTAVGTAVIYATYWYTDLFSDTVITDFLTRATDEIEKETNRKWDTPTSATSYFDGKPTLSYPTTDRPFISDYDKPDGIVLPNQPVTAINSAFFLQAPAEITKFFNYDDGTAAYTDKTTAINSTVQAPFTLFDDAPATNDIVYIGSANPFLGVDIVLSTVGVDNGSTAIDWEYYNGTSWVDITETEGTTGSSIFTASGTVTWTYPYGWAKTTINSESQYWIRGTLTDDYSTDPIVSTMTIRDAITEVIEMRNLSLQNNTVWFRSKEILAGVRNVRIDYQYGTVTTPTYISDLAVSIASLDAYISLSGGSYDDATSYTLGSKSVTIGEVYVNIREVITQFRKRIEDVYRLVGKRAQIATI
jgi:hypothetical protein